MRCVICISSGSLRGIAPDPNMGSRSCARNIAGLSTQKFHLLEPQLVLLHKGDDNQTTSDRSLRQWRNAFSGTVYGYILLTSQWRRLYRTQVRFVSALTVISFVLFCFFIFLFVTQISRERLNGFAPNSQRTRVWIVAWTNLNVKVKGQRSPGKKRKTAESSPLTIHSKASDVYAVRCHPAANDTIAAQPESDGVMALHADGGLRAVCVW